MPASPPTARLGRRPSVDSASGNAQAALFMTLAMFGYVVNDAFMRLATEQLPLYQAVAMRGGLILATVFVWMHRTGVTLDLRVIRSWPMVIRIAAEVVLTIAYLNALIRLEFANISAIMQVVPLVVTLAAALFLGESVGWRRYAAIAVGFIGMLIIVRPASDAFNRYTVLVLIAVVAVTIRDLVTRRLPSEVPSLLLTWLTAAGIFTMGTIASIGQGWVAPTAWSGVLLVGAAGFLITGYYFSIRTVRVGEISAAAPFRYTGLMWGVVLGYFVFSEIPDAPTVIGAAIIIAASLYSIHRERQLARRTAAA